MNLIVIHQDTFLERVSTRNFLHFTYFIYKKRLFSNVENIKFTTLIIYREIIDQCYCSVGNAYCNYYYCYFYLTLYKKKFSIKYFKNITCEFEDIIRKNDKYVI